MNTPPVTQDRIVNVVTTLAAMLGQCTAERESSDKAAHTAVSVASDLAERLERTQQDLSYAEARATTLHNDLAQASLREREGFRLSGQASLFRLFVENAPAPTGDDDEPSRGDDIPV